MFFACEWELENSFIFCVVTLVVFVRTFLWLQFSTHHSFGPGYTMLQLDLLLHGFESRKYCWQSLRLHSMQGIPVFTKRRNLGFGCHLFFNLIWVLQKQNPARLLHFRQLQHWQTGPKGLSSRTSKLDIFQKNHLKFWQLVCSLVKWKMSDENFSAICDRKKKHVKIMINSHLWAYLDNFYITRWQTNMANGSYKIAILK